MPAGREGFLVGGLFPLVQMRARLSVALRKANDLPVSLVDFRADGSGGLDAALLQLQPGRPLGDDAVLRDDARSQPGRKVLLSQLAETERERGRHDRRDFPTVPGATYPRSTTAPLESLQTTSLVWWPTCAWNTVCFSELSADTLTSISGKTELPSKRYSPSSADANAFGTSQWLHAEIFSRYSLLAFCDLQRQRHRQSLVASLANHPFPTSCRIPIRPRDKVSSPTAPGTASRRSSAPPPPSGSGSGSRASGIPGRVTSSETLSRRNLETSVCCTVEPGRASAQW